MRTKAKGGLLDKNELDPFSNFNRTPACDGQTQGHGMYTAALAKTQDLHGHCPLMFDLTA